MTTALDTNVLVVLLRGIGELADAAQAELDGAARLGPLVLAAPVYAELLASPGRDGASLDRFRSEARITVDWQFDESLWRDAAAAYRGYAERRRRQQGDPGPRRILADFLIGAHAARRAATLLTFDPKLFRSSFPTLTVRVPGEG